MSMLFAKVLRCYVLFLLIGLGGCSLLQPKPAPKPKPEIVDTQAQTEAALSLELEQDFTHALVLLRDEEFEQAKQVLAEITTEYPDYAGPWANLAIAQLSLQQYDESLLSIDKSLAVDEGFCPSLPLKGVILRELGQFSEAKIVYLQAIECDPSDITSLYNLGILSDLYLHDEISALFYYQSYLVAKKGNKDNTVEKWVVALKRRVPEEQRMALVVKKEPVIKEPSFNNNTNSIDVVDDISETQLAGEK